MFATRAGEAQETQGVIDNVVAGVIDNAVAGVIDNAVGKVDEGGEKSRKVSPNRCRIAGGAGTIIEAVSEATGEEAIILEADAD